MNDRARPSACQLGMISAVAVVLLATVYGAVLSAGLLSLGARDQPIGDPWFTMLEVLIIAIMPALVTLMAAIHIWSSARAKPLALSGLAFMSMTAGLTMSVHAAILMIGGDEPHLSFRWPSLAYALDIVAWDLFFPLSILSAAPVFGGNRLQDMIRWMMILSGVLALAGLSGVLTGDMRLRHIGILGYVGVFPVAAALLALLFRREARSRRGDDRRRGEAFIAQAIGRSREP